jgi:two-component system, cell cycle sensor histidine kinase and response regulator CckA
MSDAADDRYRALFNVMGLGVLFVDAAGRIVEANPAALRMLGASEADLGTLPALPRHLQLTREDGTPFPEDDRPALAALATGRPVRSVVMGILNPAAEARWVSIDSYPELTGGDPSSAQVLTTIRDITREKDAADALRSSEALFKDLVTHLDVGLIAVTLDGLRLQWNPAALKLHGLTAHDRGLDDLAHALDIFALYTLDGAPLPADQLPAVRLARGESFQDVGLNLRRRGTDWIRTFSYSGTLIRGTDGSPAMGLLSFRDVTASKHALDAARQAEAGLQRAVAAGRVGLWDWDLTTNAVYFSPEWKRQIGFEPDELGDDFETWRDRLHPDDLDATIAYVRRYVANPEGQFENEFRFRHKDGSYRWILAHASVDRNEDGTAVRLLGSHIDITDRRVAEEELRTNERVLRSLFNAIPESVFLMSVDGIILAANDTFAGRVGLTASECVGLDTFSLIPEAARVRRRTWVTEVVRTGRPFVQEDERDGLWLEHHIYPVVERDGAIGRLVVFAVDTTTRRRMERDLRAEQQRLQESLEALRDSKQRFTHLIETTFDWVWEVDAKGRYVYSNDRVTQLLGYTRDEVVGMTPFDLMPAGEAQRVRPIFMSLAAERAPLNALENTCRHKNGSLVILETSGVPIAGPNGEFLGYRGMDRDVTGRRRLEDQLRQAQKLEAVGQLAGGVAHDFNNILAAIMMHLGLLQTYPDLNDETRHALGDLEAEARRAAGLTRQLLMFSRRSVLDVRTIQLNEIVTNLLKMLRRLIGEHIDLRFEARAGLPPIEADAGMLEQVLVNLVVNARDSMPKGGRVTITTGVEHLDEARAAVSPDRRMGTFARVSVVDTGSGMDPTTVARIFEPFFSTKAPGHGTGLGLATVHGIVAQHRGWVEVASSLGVGTTFDVYLPASPGASLSPGERDDRPMPARGKETVLVVEDEGGVRRMIALTLASQGYRVLEAANGREALRVWQDRGSEVDLLFTDMVMPEGISGLELSERLKELKPRLRVIISSGYSQEVVQAGVPNRPGLLYLPKPYDSRTLATTVRAFLDQKPS